MTTYTTKTGAPYPDDNALEANKPRGFLKLLAQFFDVMPGIQTVTTAQRDALTKLWPGIVVFNTDLSTLQLNVSGTSGSGNWANVTPSATGDLCMSMLSTKPGWGLMDGHSASRTGEAASLWQAFGATNGFGAGNGTTTFTFPDWRGRGPMGFDSAQTEFNALGKTGGAKTVQLSLAQLPSHHFTVTGVIDGTAQNTFGNGGTQAFGLANPGRVNFDTNTLGGDQAHNNLGPYGTTNFFIKY